MLLAKAWALSSQSPESDSKNLLFSGLENFVLLYTQQIFFGAYKVLDSGYMIVNRSSTVSTLAEFTV